MFKNRQDAGRQLARALDPWRAKHPLILGLPRGGVVVAAMVARELATDLDVVLVKKLRAPGNPELAVGAVDEDGQVLLNPMVMRATGADERYLASERQQRLTEMAAQRAQYRLVRPRIPIAGRLVILVDDGLATGATMQAAVMATKQAGATEIVVAVPVAPPETVALFDVVVCLQTPEEFRGVGQFYEDFTQTEDTEVVEWLRGG